MFAKMSFRTYVARMLNDYRELIQNEITERTKRNSSYSMRSFAKAAGLKAPHLCSILKGTKGLSVASANRVAEVMGLDDSEAEEFVDLVCISHSRSKSEKLGAEKRLALNQSSKLFQQMNDDQLQIVSNWHHFAILHLIELDDAEFSFTWFASRLGLPESDVKDSLRLLKKLGFIDTTGTRWRLTQNFLATPDVPSRAIRNHHHQILQLAGRALQTQKIEERDFANLYMAIRKESVAEAKKWLKEFRRNFCQKLSKGNAKDALYCLSMQFFEITSNLKDGNV